MKLILTCFFFYPFFSAAAPKGKASFLPNNFKTEFIKEYKSVLKGKIKKSQGVLKYAYPSKIRLEMSDPDKIIFVTNEKMSWFYRGPFIENQPGTLSVSKSQKNGLNKFFDGLKNGLKTNKLYQAKSEKLTTTLIFEKKYSKDLGLKMATFVFSSGKKAFSALKNISLVYNDNKKVKLSFKNIKINIAMDEKKIFTFKIPENTRINE